MHKRRHPPPAKWDVALFTVVFKVNLPPIGLYVFARWSLMRRTCMPLEGVPVHR